MNAALWLKPLLGLACALAFLAALRGMVARKTPKAVSPVADAPSATALQKIAHARRLLACAWLANLAVLALNCHLAQAPALGNMFHVMVLLPLTLPVFYLFARRLENTDGDLLACFAGVAAVALLATLFMDTQSDWRRMPALRSPWFVPHVFTYLLAYALLAVATALRVADKHARHAERASQSDTLARAGFAFLTLGLCSGALWADEAWGNYWSWDIKEVWALITWILYLVYFHLKKETRLSRPGAVVLLLAFAALLFTFFAVNLLPKINSLHSYAG